ncbi:hypothetical protein C8R47DRAFT_1080453 [Mycena vitilis]|nr:hypothetical protein C8R47DRAFT_1080453 [Mycena vitilis]
MAKSRAAALPKIVFAIAKAITRPWQKRAGLEDVHDTLSSAGSNPACSQERVLLQCVDVGIKGIRNYVEKPNTYDVPTFDGCYPFVTGLLTSLHATTVSHITNLRLGGVVNTHVLPALPAEWLLNVTRPGINQLQFHTSQQPTFGCACIAEVPASSAMQALELSLNLYPLVLPYDLSDLEIFLARLLPPHRLASIITTVTARRSPNYIEALRRHYNYCLLRADVVKVQWEDGQIDKLVPAFPGLFADGTMEVGKLSQRRCDGTFQELL